MEPDKLFEKNYKLAGGKKSFDFAALMELLMQLLSGVCPVARSKAHARRFPEATERMLEDHLKDSEFTMSSKDRKTLATAARKTFIALPNNKIEAMRPKPQQTTTA